MERRRMIDIFWMFMFCIKQYWVNMIYSIKHNKLSCLLGKYIFRGMGHVFFIINILHKLTKKYQCYFLCWQVLSVQQTDVSSGLSAQWFWFPLFSGTLDYLRVTEPSCFALLCGTHSYEGFVQPSYFSPKPLLSCQSDCCLTVFFMTILWSVYFGS